MPKITPTFADQVAGNGAAGPIHITPQHEPLKENPTLPVIEGVDGKKYHVSLGNVVTPIPDDQPLKVALIGTAPSSRMLAPYNDPSWKIWACSPGNMNQIPRFDVWFEVHCNFLWAEFESYGKPYIEWLKTHKTPVYMQPTWPSNSGETVPITQIVANALPFPWEDLVAEFGRGFFTSSFSWMMAFAIKQGAKEIALYGIDMASRDEYILQRPGFGFFRWQAESRGIKISAPHESDIMQPPPLYGFADANPHMRKWQARRNEIKGRIAQMEPQAGQINQQVTYLRGADEDMDYNIQIWGGLADEVALLTSENARLKREIEGLKAPKVDEAWKSAGDLVQWPLLQPSGQPPQIAPSSPDSA